MALNADFRLGLAIETPLNKIQQRLYQTIFGELLYIAICTPPVILFAVGALAQSLHAQSSGHKNMIHRVLRYLSGTRKLGVMSGANPGQIDLAVYLDADWASCTLTRQSITGNIICVNGAPVNWKSLRHMVVALSSTEAE